MLLSEWFYNIMYSGSLNNGQVQYSNHKEKETDFAWVKVTYALMNYFLVSSTIVI